MSNGDPNVNRTQATYETACLAIATVLRFVANVSDEVPLPQELADKWTALHDAICREQDNQLRALGYKPEEF
jgi:hypothetical protein